MACKAVRTNISDFSVFLILRYVVSLIGSLFFVCLLLQGHANSANESRGLKIVVNTSQNEQQEMPLYSGSYALLIGESNYRAGWPSIESIPGELARVESMLTSRGFKVEKHIDPDSHELVAAFSEFIDKYGYDRENRLLFFYSGHGYTRQGGRKGYLVPVDAPDPDKNEKEFLKKALGMNQILSWSRDIEAKHVLFLFDSCFSGTIFKQKDKPKPPKHITMMTVEPVRQYITAGSAGQTVPANSTFTPMFIDAIKFNLADLNKDGYVSGTELGLYLQEMVPRHSNQSPQFGKISDYDLSRGDFIFVAGDVPEKQTAALDKDYQNGGMRSNDKDNLATRQPAASIPDEEGQGVSSSETKQQQISSVEKEKYLTTDQSARPSSDKKMNFMVLIDEKVDDSENMGNADKIITEYLLGKGVEVVDPELIKAKVDVDQKLNVMTGSPQSAAALGMEFGADIVIIGKATAKGSDSRVRESDLHSYQARVNLKAVQTSTAEVLDVDTATAAAIHVDDVIGTSKAIQNATQIIAERMIARLLNKTESLEGENLHKISLIVNDVQQIWQVAAVKHLLRKQIAGVQDVIQISFISGIANFDIYSRGDVEYLAKELTLAKPQHFSLSVIKMTESKLVVKLTPPDQ